jgi:catalase
VVIGRASSESAPDTAKAFTLAIGRHRHWDRRLAESVPA